MSMTPAKRRGIVENVELKMTGNRSIDVLGTGYKNMKDMVWVMVRDDGTISPQFKSVCGTYSHSLYAEDFTPVSDLSSLTTEKSDGYTLNQRHAVKTFTTMLERAKLYRENGCTDGFEPDSGICDNISDCRPDRADYDNMVRVKDNVIRVVPSYSGNYHYPVKHPMPRPDRDEVKEAEHAWDSNSNKWSGEYGAMRIIQLEELINHIKTKWDEKLVERLTPAQQRGIIIHETVCQHIKTGNLWVMQRDDDSSAPYFIPFGNTGTDGRTDIRLSDLRILTDGMDKKRSVRAFIKNANRIKSRTERLETQMAMMKSQLDKLKGELALNDFQLRQQHGVKRIDN